MHLNDKSEYIGIVTLTTGFNYGTTLQAFALQEIIRSLHYIPKLIVIKGSIIKGMDFRLEKLFVMLYRLMRHPVLMEKVKHYVHWIKTAYSNEIKKKIIAFSDNKLDTVLISYSALKKISKSSLYKAFICGSDQIWDASAMYVNPAYYLQFCPRGKKIAYAPSFGKDTIPKYNQNSIKKMLQGFDDISIRESRGAEMIKELINKDVPVVLDPTLLLNKESWENFYTGHPLAEFIHTMKDPLVLFFLDKPNPFVINSINACIKSWADKKQDIICITTEKEYFKRYFYDTPVILPNLDPFEFLNVMSKAKIVLTDSYHGVLFSINFNRNFWAFERNYIKGQNQSSRIMSILALLSLHDRYIIDDCNKDWTAPIEFPEVNTILNKKREHSLQYLENCIEKRK